MRSIHQQLFGWSVVSVTEVVAESVGGRFKHGKRLDVGLLLHRVRAPRREGNLRVNTGVLRRRFDRGTPAQNDEVGERDPFPVGLQSVKFLLNPL